MKKKDFIAEDIIGKIYQNKYKKEEKLPTERELAIQYGTSRDTVRNALKKLVDLNFLDIIQGKGIFVKDIIGGSSIIYNSLLNKNYKQISSKILYLKEVFPSIEMQKIFDISEDEALWEYKRIRIVDLKKIQIELTRIPKKLFPNLALKNIEGSFHEYVTLQNYNISHFITTYTSINLKKEDAELLNSKKGKAVMLIKNRGILSDSTMFEYSELICEDYSCSYISNFNPRLQTLRKNS